MKFLEKWLKANKKEETTYEEKICSFCYDPCYERSNSTFPAYCICRGRRTGIEHCHFPGWIWGCLLESDGGAF
mgnify:CR=1 FL=1